MTKPNIAEIEKQLDGITPGKWCETSETEPFLIRIVASDNKVVGNHIHKEADARFIASAPSTIRSLKDYVKELEARVKELEQHRDEWRRECDKFEGECIRLRYAILDLHRSAQNPPVK